MGFFFSDHTGRDHIGFGILWPWFDQSAVYINRLCDPRTAAWPLRVCRLKNDGNSNIRVNHMKVP